MFAKLLKKSGNSVGKRTISDLTEIQKEDIIHLRDQGMMPSKIAEELGIDAGQVHTVVMLDKNRKAKQTGDSGQQSDPVKDLQIQKQQLEIQAQIDDLEFKREIRNQQRTEQTMDLFRQHPEDDDYHDEPEGELAQIVKGAAMGFMQSLQSRQGTQGREGFTPISPALPNPQQQAEVAPQEDAKIDLPDDEIKALINQFGPKVQMLKVMSDEHLRQQAKIRFPEYSDETIDRAITLIRQ